MIKKSILIEGIGGIGGVVSAHLIKSGYNVTLLTSNQKITDAIRKNGIQVVSSAGSVNFHADVYTNLEDLPQGAKYDIIFLIMKATSVVDAAVRSLNYLKSDGYLASFQNGIVEDDIANAIGGPEKLLAVTIAWGGSMHAPGVYEKTSKAGKQFVGELNGEITPRLLELKEILSAVTDTVATDNIYGIKWSKLALNATITSFGVITGLTVGEMMKRRYILDMFLHEYREVIDTALGNNIKLEKVAADPFILYGPKDAGWFTRHKLILIARIIGIKYKKLRSSSLQSLERGRKTEIEFLNGYVVKKAHEKNIPVPVNELVVKMVHEIEDKKRVSKPENVLEMKKELGL